jgi:protein disulfide-isomerase
MRKELPPEQVKANQALQEKYGIEGYPTVVIVNAEGKEIARTGYKEGGAESYVAHLKDLLAKK